jgi:hypothetical protein
MSKNMFTPAPWTVVTETFEPGGKSIHGQCPVVRMFGACDAVVVSLGAPLYEQQANALLIASAPDLLNALIACADWLSEAPRGSIPWECHVKALAAISKAKGLQ